MKAIEKKTIDKFNQDLQKEYGGAYHYDSSNTTHKARLFSRNRKNKAGLIKIEIEVLSYTNHGDGTHTKSRKHVDTLILVNPKNWNNKTRRISKNEPEYEHKTNTIMSKLADVQKYISSFGLQLPQSPYAIDLDISNLHELFPNRNKVKSLELYIEDYIKMRKSSNTKQGTTKNYQTLQFRISKFDKYRGKTSIMSDINIQWSIELNEWMVNIQKYKIGTIGRAYRYLITVLHHFYKMTDEIPNLGLSDKFTRKEFKHGGEAINDPNPLTYEQREIIKNEYWDSTDKAARLMLIQLYTGMRHSDVELIKPANINQNTLKFKPRKTDKDTVNKKITVLQPLNPVAVELFNEASNDASCYKLSNQKYNDKIEVYINALKKKYKNEFANVDQITSHNFRDTFISIAVEKQVNFESIMKWVGISSFDILKRYIKTSDEFAKNEMKKMG